MGFEKIIAESKDMEERKPLVSIIVRTKDRPKLLKRALKSIADQTYRPMEVVLLNDGGCDLNIDELKGGLGEVSLNYIRFEENIGRTRAGNAGIKDAKGKYIGFLDDDDEFYPEHVQTLVSFLEHSDYKVAYTDSLMVYKEYDPETFQLKEKKSELVFSKDYDYNELFFENYIPFMCLMFGNEVLRDSGGLHPDFDLYEDWELLIRIGSKYPFYHIRKTTACYNQWDINLQISQRNRNVDILRQSYLKVINKHFDKFTPDRIHSYVSNHYHARHRLKELTYEYKLLKDQAIKTSNHVLSLEKAIEETRAHANGLDVALRAKDSRISNLEAVVRERDTRIHNLDAALTERDARIHNLDADVREWDHHVTALENALAEKAAYIDAIQSGRGWKLLATYFRMRDKLLPMGTKRRMFVKLMLRSVLHPKDVIVNLNRTNVKKFFYYLDKADPLTVEKKVERKLSPEDFDGGTTGGESSGRTLMSTAGTNYFKFFFDMNTKKSGDYIPLSRPALPKTDIKLIAFYLPQFHPIAENDEWWGKGFTEWTNVTRAIPQFIGHYQPRLPGELGFYDLRILDVQKRQSELAKQYGIHGFCFHFYWFHGTTLLETPLRNFVEHVDFPFCIDWANENWTKRWDGQENEILIAQEHSPEDDIAFIEHVSTYLRHKNYIRINSKPLLIIYRPALFPNPKATAERWRTWCRLNGIGEIYLAATHSFEHIDPRDIGYDAVIEFPPNTYPLQDIASRVNISNQNYKGLIFDYRDAIELSRNDRAAPYKKFRGIFPSWDNESRRPGRGSVIINSSPDAYKAWLRTLSDYTIRHFEPEERLIFVNAWNEWAEGAYLEPDRRYGYAYLQATAEALVPLPGGATSLPGNWKILFVSHDACKGGAQAVLLNIISWFKQHTFASLRILCLDGGELESRFRELGDTIVLSEWRSKGITEEELARKLREFCGGAPDLIYCNSVASGREYPLLRLLETPVIMHFHELEMSIKRYAAEWIDDVLKYSSHIMACSSAVKKNLIKNYGVEPPKISTVYASINPEKSIQIANSIEKLKIRKKLGLKENKFLVFGCGIGMVFRKGADLFIEAARILRSKGFDNFHFYWIGNFDLSEMHDRYGLWANHLTRLKEDGLERYVTFMGFKDNPKQYLQAGDMFLLTSREDPFPLVTLEAAECGLPTCCFSGAGGMPDFVGDDAGFIVPYEDVQTMAEKIVILMKNEDLSRQLGERARQKVLSGFTVEQTAPHILAACRTAAQKKPAVSVIVPNYNHAPYLQKRLDSVFNQTFKDFEVVLLDDSSTDGSLELLNAYADNINVRIVKNEQNSGSPFRQWLKGIDMAQADIIWIAESDDISDSRFLETLLPAFEKPEVKLAYSNSHVMDEHGRVTWDYENGEYLTSLSQTKWKKSYLVSAAQEINDGLGVKDTILNISAVLFRRFAFTKEFLTTLEGMCIAGDWYFIVNAIKDGEVHYDAAKLNYHRRHVESVIGKAVTEKKMEDFFREFCMVQEFIFDNYQLDGHFHQKWESYLRKQWNDFYPGRPFEELQVYYPFDEMRERILRKAKKPAVSCLQKV